MTSEQIKDALKLAYNDAIKQIFAIYSEVFARRVKDLKTLDPLDPELEELDKYTRDIYKMVELGERRNPTKHVAELRKLLKMMVVVHNTVAKRGELVKIGTSRGPRAEITQDVIDALRPKKSNYLIGRFAELYEDNFIKGSDTRTKKGLKEAIARMGDTDGRADVLKLYQIRAGDKGVQFNKIVDDFFDDFIERNKLKIVGNDKLKTVRTWLNDKGTEFGDILTVRITGVRISGDYINEDGTEEGHGKSLSKLLGTLITVDNSGKYEGDDLDSLIIHTIENDGAAEGLPDAAQYEYKIVKNEPTEVHGMDSGDCLRKAIKKITGVSYDWDTVEEIPEFMETHGVHFNTYNNYGAPLEGVAKSSRNSLDLIIYNVGKYSHAIALNAGDINTFKQNREETKSMDIEGIADVYNIVFEHMLLYKANSHALDYFQDKEIDKDDVRHFVIYVFVNDYARRVLGKYAPESNGWTIYQHSRKNSFIYPYIRKMFGVTLFDRITAAINDTRDVFSSFPQKYRRRCGFVKFSPGCFWCVDIRKAYREAFKSAVSTNMLNIYNQPVDNPGGEWYERGDFIFYVYGCEVLPCGYFYAKYLKYYKKHEPRAFYEFYPVRNTISNERFIDLIEYIDEAEKEEYTSTIGMLISKPQGYRYSGDVKTYDVKSIRFVVDPYATVHLNIILRHNANLLKLVQWVNHRGGAWPVGYNVDAAYYTDPVPVPDFCTMEQKSKSYGANTLTECETMDLLFGCAGCGKTTTLMKSAPENSLFIVKSHQLKRLYESNNRHAEIYEQIQLNHVFYQKSYLVVDECFVYTNEEVSDILAVANYNGVGICFAGDYYQLRPIIPESDKSSPRVSRDEPTLLQRCSHTYIFKNYRNKIDYSSISWLFRCIDADTWAIEGGHSKDRDALISRYMPFISIGEEYDGPVLRWYQKHVLDHIGGRWWILNNLNLKEFPMTVRKAGADKAKLHALYTKDCLYKIEEIRPELLKYFVNTHLISFYNTQGQGFDKLRIVSEEDWSYFITNPRRFYVLISRIIEH